MNGNNLTSWLDSLSGAAAKITGALNPPTTVVNQATPPAAPADNKQLWIVGGIVGVLLLVGVFLFTRD